MYSHISYALTTVYLQKIHSKNPVRWYPSPFCGLCFPKSLKQFFYKNSVGGVVLPSVPATFVDGPPLVFSLDTKLTRGGVTYRCEDKGNGKTFVAEGQPFVAASARYHVMSVPRHEMANGS